MKAPERCDHLANLSGVPEVDCPSKFGPTTLSCANGWFSLLVIVSTPPSIAQRRLMQKLPGQPPSAATVPARAPGSPPNSRPQEGAFGALKTQRPAMEASAVGGPNERSPAQPDSVRTTRTPMAALTTMLPQRALLYRRDY